MKKSLFRITASFKTLVVWSKLVAISVSFIADSKLSRGYDENYFVHAQISWELLRSIIASEFGIQLKPNRIKYI